MPCLVDEVAVGADTKHLYSHRLQLSILALEIFQLCGADKGEVGRIEEEKCPLAFDVFVADGLEAAVLIGLNGELGCVTIDD